MDLTPWLAGLTTAVVVLGTWGSLRANDEEEILTGVVLALLALMLVSFYLPAGSLPDLFQRWVILISAIAGVLACCVSVTRRVYWPVLLLPVFGVLGLAIWALWNGPGRLF